MPRFRLERGTFEYRGRSYTKGQIITQPESAPRPLNEAFRNKFTRLEDAVVPAATKRRKRNTREGVTGPSPDEPPEVLKNPEDEEPSSKPKKVEKKKVEKKVEKKKVRAPKVVTKDFPVAGEQDFQVTKLGGKFFVQDIDDPDTNLNNEPLEESEVVDFIMGQVED